MLIALLGGVAIAIGFRSPVWGVAIAMLIIGVGVIRTDGIPVMLIVILLLCSLSFIAFFWFARQGR